jgi:G3E family GTPase
MAIPVYVFTGFLDSGKTRFMQGTLEDERFNAGEKTLLLVCEEGEEEYDPSRFSGSNVYMEVIEDQDAVDEQSLEALRKKYRAERVCVELNGMQLVSDFYAKLPKSWVVYQEIMFADSRNFPLYNANMRSLVVDKVGGCEMIVFNRVDDSVDKMELHKIVRAINRRCDIAYEDAEGNVEYDEIEDPLPFDIDADIIDIKDDDYGIWYRDVTEDMQKYSGKTVRFKAQVAHTKKVEKGCFVPGRFVMTCCVEDIQFMGFVCQYEGAQELQQRSWVTVTAKISLRYHKLYKEMGPVLTALEITPAEKAEQDVVTF